MRHRVQWIGSCMLGSGLALATVACIDGAPSSPLGEAQFTASATQVGPSTFAPRESQTNVGAGGAPSMTQPIDQPGASGSGAFVPPMMTGRAGAGPSAGAGMIAVAPSAGGMGGRGGATAMGGRGGAGGGAAGSSAAGSMATPNPAAAGTLTITFTSVNQRGRYAPRNVGAVWIETGSGMFVKTIERWAGIRANHLTRWAQSSGGWGSIFGGGNTADRMDAISRATLSRHEKHMLTWDMKDLMGQVVPDGKYKVGIEVTEDNFVPGANVLIEFDKGAAASMVMPPDQAPYSGLVIQYQP